MTDGFSGTGDFLRLLKTLEWKCCLKDTEIIPMGVELWASKAAVKVGTGGRATCCVLRARGTPLCGGNPNVGAPFFGGAKKGAGASF